MAILVLANGGHIDVAHRGPELDEGVSLVVGIGRTSLTVGTEISVMADSALEAVASDVAANAVATSTVGTIATDAVVGG